MMRAFDNIGYVLESVLTGLEMTARTREHLALILWGDIVGEQVARITQVHSVRSGVLHVDVESSAWAQELQMYRPDLIQKINRYIGGSAIKDIHFRAQPNMKRTAPRAGSRTRPRKGATPDMQLTLDECQQIAETARRIHDPEMRETIASTMASYRRMEHWMVQEGWKRCQTCRALYQRERKCPFCVD